MADEQQRQGSGTVATDYGSCYYNDAHLGGYDNYTWDNDQWRGFFQLVADRIVAIVGRGRMLDVGCAKGLLVQALREKGVHAQGFDISQHAVDAAHEDVREHLWVASATDSIEGRYDLVSMIEMIEHMSPAEAQQALDNIAKATDRVLFSSSPADHDEPTHINTKPTATWAAWFAERGFFRRTDVDLTFLSPWAVLFERGEPSTRELVQRYESHLSGVTAEAIDKRNALLGAHRNISMLRDQVAAGTSAQLAEQVELVKKFEAEVLDARHKLLVNRDHVVGTEAEIGRLNREVLRLTHDLRHASTRLSSLEKRKDVLLDRVAGLRGRLETAQARNKSLRQRVASLEQQRGAVSTSFARRVARKFGGEHR